MEHLKKDMDNLKELIKLKDRQIDDLHQVQDQEREAHMSRDTENKELKKQLTKREFEMKELVKTLKVFNEEKKRLE